MYADYQFYKDNWSGRIPEASYNFVANRATQTMDYFTFNRIKPETVTDKIKLCQCELCDFIYVLDQQQDARQNVEGKGVIKSETVDNWKVDYGVAQIPQEYSSKAAGAGVDGILNSICRKYLTQPVNLMFVGVEEIV